MTERDEAAEGFLERWSRKKIEAEHEAPPPATVDRDAAEAAPAEDRGNAPAPAIEFDLSKLPSLDSITAATDIRDFLAPGVPKEIARAALRRAWSADPAIRDFKGLAENDWDFTDPTAMPGFGALPPGTDVKKLVAQIFGERDERGRTRRRSAGHCAATGACCGGGRVSVCGRGAKFHCCREFAKVTLHGATMILRRTIMVLRMKQSNRRVLAITAVHFLNRS